MTPDLATVLQRERATHRRILRHYSGDGLVTEAIAVEHTLELLMSQLETFEAIERDRRQTENLELLLLAAVRQHGGRLRISYGAMRDVHPHMRIRSFADLTFKHQLLELVDATREQDAGPAPWAWRWWQRPLVEAVVGAVQLAVLRGMRMGRRWRVYRAVGHAHLHLARVAAKGPRG